MNIGWLYNGLNSIELRSRTLRGNIKEPQFRTIFPAFFTNLTLVERHSLKALGKYDYFIAVFDRLNAGVTFSQSEVNEIKNVLNTAVQLKNTLLSSGLARAPVDVASSLNVTFPVRSTESTVSTFKDEVDWFFDGIQKSLVIFEGLEHQEIIILNVENELLSIAVSIDWRMVLVIAWLIREYKMKKVNAQTDAKAISHLKNRGVDNATIDNIENQLLEAANAAEMDSLITKLKVRLAEISNIKLSEGWENHVRLLIKRIRDGLSRGYKIEAEIRNFDRLGVEASEKTLEEMKKIVQYDRDIDDEEITGGRLKIEQS